MRKRIAVLIAQIDESTQNRFLNEFITEAYRYNYDVCIFTMYQKYQETPLRSIGDANIFGLVNYALFDAVLIMADTLLTPGLSKKVQQDVKDNFNGPVLVIDQESEYFDSVMMDHYTPVRKIIDHLIEVHGYSRIAFLGGKEGHPHSVQRLQAFIDSMEFHGVRVRETWVGHGNYWYDAGERFAEMLLKNKDDFPEAIACANDCMAIGVAAKLEESGYRIPEDVAITGYDSLEVGRYSPAPLTSASIPADECGVYSMRRLHAAIKGKPQPEFVPFAPLFIGGSCGCPCDVEKAPKNIRSQWRTQHSARSMFSDFNHILEDMLGQNTIKGFMQVLIDYAYQVGEFGTFDVCLNEGFMKPDIFAGEEAVRNGYTPTMYKVASFEMGKAEGGTISFEDKFLSKDLTPRLYEERLYPTTLIFNPLYFEDRCFGYTVLNNREKITLYDKEFRVWMRSVMQGMEAFYRQGYMFALIDKIKAGQVRDSLTGLYNYEGFLQNANKIVDSYVSRGYKLNILTIDIKGMKHLNELYGRATGERAIMAVARILQNCIHEDEVCCRMCNDEFLIAVPDDVSSARASEVFAVLRERIKAYQFVDKFDFDIQLHYANLVGEPKRPGELEVLVNQAVSIKNHKKNANKNTPVETKDLMDEIKRNQIVTNILNKNLLTYYYQPIVNLRDGSIYAYEALMRCEVEKISPTQIIQAATYMNRLQDVERNTLLNVTRDVEENIDAFGRARVFVNSLPGVELNIEDDIEFATRLLRNKGRFVIEFTEESELDDNQLRKFKNKYNKFGCQIAVDDYGAGYSNANNLLRYMPKYVKIDRMLISEISDNPQKQHFVRNIIDFAHANNIIALAEGVRTKEEMQECVRLGADLLQGYYAGVPTRIPIGEIAPGIKAEIERAYAQASGWHANGK